MLAWPTSLYACACCGLDNTWAQHKSSLNNYTGEVLHRLNIVSGDFDDAPVYQNSYPVVSVRKAKDAYIFHTKSGDIRFNYKNLVEHRTTDITFITNAKYKYSDNADIYHELILRGNLLIPDAIRSSFEPDIPSAKLQKSMGATMIFQGFGNACIEGPEFEKWLIKLNSKDINFQGQGLVKSKSSVNK